MPDRKTEDDETFIPEREADTRDEIDLEEIEEVAADKIKSIKKKLKEAEKEKIQYLEDLQRVKADFLNSKRRLEEQLASDRERITDAFITDLLPLLDSFDLAIGEDKSPGSKDEAWYKGMEAIHAQLWGILKRYGVAELESLGKDFDPFMHEAVSEASVSDSAEDGKVLSVLQKGYERNGQVIRPARVTVGVKK